MKKLTYILTFAFILASFTGCRESEQATPQNLAGGTASVIESGAENETSAADEEIIPEDEPTFLTAPDGTPIYTSELTRYQDTAEFHGTHEQFPLEQFNKQTFKIRDILDHPEVVCEGFAYAFIPRFNINYSAAPDKFEEFDDESLRYIGEPLPDGNDYFKLKVGDKFGGLTVKSACTSFNYYNAIGVDDPDSIPGLYLFGAEIQYEGEVEMTGCMHVLETASCSTAGDMYFYPDGDCVSQIPAALYCTEYGNPKRGVFYMPAERGCSYGDFNEITLGNMNNYDIDFDGLKPGDKNVRVKVTIKDPSIITKWGYMWCSGEPTAVTVIDN